MQVARVIKTWKNRYGETFHTLRTWEIDCNGKETFYKDVTTTPEGVWSLMDDRTLKQMQEGCCPPQFLIEMLEGAGPPEEQGGSVEEAMALHATGYGIKVD